MVVSFFQRGGIVAKLALMGLLATGSAPLLANTSAASADVAAPVREAQGTSISGGDEQFRQLFAQWEALDGGDDATPVASVAITDIAVPSRNPLGASTLTSGYGMRNHPVLGGRRRHTGIDLAAPTGTPVYATADGIVSRADRYSSYGLYISIEHGAQLQTRYAHLSRLAVAAGEQVRKGEIIGYVGSTGRSTGPHLHYEVRVAGEAVNPVPYMAESGAQRTLALAEGNGAQGGGARGGGE